jgi:hypothetical protein
MEGIKESKGSKKVAPAMDILTLRKDINNLIGQAINTAKKKKGDGLVDNLRNIQNLVNLYIKMNPEPKEEIKYIEIRVVDELDGGDYKRIARVGKIDTTGVTEEERKDELKQRREEKKQEQEVMNEDGTEGNNEQVGGET